MKMVKNIYKKRPFLLGFFVCLIMFTLLFLLMIMCTSSNKNKVTRLNKVNRQKQLDFLNADILANSPTQKQIKPVPIGVKKSPPKPVSIGTPKSKVIIKDQVKPVLAGVKKSTPKPVSIGTPKSKLIIKKQVKPVPIETENGQNKAYNKHIKPLHVNSDKQSAENIKMAVRPFKTDLLSDDDNDGFSKEIELKYDTDPENKKSHPALARLLNLIEFREVLLPSLSNLKKVGDGKYSYYSFEFGRRKYMYSKTGQKDCIITFGKVKYKIVKIEFNGINQKYWANGKVVKNKKDKSKIFLKSVYKYPKQGEYIIDGKYSIVMQSGKNSYSPVPAALIENLNGGYKYLVYVGDYIQLSKK